MDPLQGALFYHKTKETERHVHASKWSSDSDKGSTSTVSPEEHVSSPAQGGTPPQPDAAAACGVDMRSKLFNSLELSKVSPTEWTEWLVRAVQGALFLDTKQRNRKAHACLEVLIR